MMNKIRLALWGIFVAVCVGLGGLITNWHGHNVRLQTLKEAQSVEEQQEGHEIRYLSSLYELVPKHLSQSSLETIGLFGMRPTENGGELKVLVEDSDGRRMVLTYEANHVTFWIKSVQPVSRGSSVRFD